MGVYQQVEGRHGRFLANPNDYYIGGGLIEYGEYAEAEWQVLDQLLLPGKDAIEVGSNIGALSVPMARKLAGLGRRLLAIEPQPVLFQNLCANLALNDLFNVQAENAAVSTTPGSLQFALPDYTRPGSNFGAVRMGAMNDADATSNATGKPHAAPIMQRVRAARLDDLVPEHFDVGLIKIDVEGFELQVLQSAVQTLTRHRPVLSVENDQVDKSQALIEWLWDAGYNLWWHKFLLFNPDNYRCNPENRFIHDGKHVMNVNMLALPCESTLQIDAVFPRITDSSEHPFA